MGVPIYIERNLEREKQTSDGREGGGYKTSSPKRDETTLGVGLVLSIYKTATKQSYTTTIGRGKNLISNSSHMYIYHHRDQCESNL